MQHSFSQALPFCLVIDPSLVIRTIVVTELRRAGYPPCAAYATSMEALHAISSQCIPIPDIALICWRLPKIDGIEVLQHMKRAQYHTASIMMLDQDQNSALIRAKARLAGARNTLVKPFTMQELRTRLASLTSLLSR